MFSKNTLDKYSIVDFAYTEEMAASSFEHYSEWVKKGLYGGLNYLADHRKNLRKNIKDVYPHSRSALVFLFSYEETVALQKKIKVDDNYNGFHIASYALAYEGNDYHLVIKKYLEELADIVRENYPEVEINQSLDIHPILERDLAFRSGLGFFGKNSMLISPKYGSYFLIGSLILNKKLKDFSNRNPVTDHCGTCRSCVDACPTSAIDEKSRTLIADKCISTYTIENFKDDSDAPDAMEQGNGEIFGCDICQDVCPWNKRRERLGYIKLKSDEASYHERIKYFLLRSREQVRQELSELSNRAFKREFKNTPFERTGRVGLLKNILFWLK